MQQHVQSILITYIDITGKRRETFFNFFIITCTLADYKVYEDTTTHLK